MQLIKQFACSLNAFGFSPRKFREACRGLPKYLADRRAFSKQRNGRSDFPFGQNVPCLDESKAGSGTASGHYFHQDLLVARRIYENKPERHLDVGSRVDGFVAHVAVFRPIEVLDVRPLPHPVFNVRFVQADLMAPLADHLLSCCDSLSCLHALEHFGLGRYGDPVNYDGHLLGLNNLHRLLKKNGRLYFSVPIGPQRIEFNAHRVFSVRYLLDYFSASYQLDRFSYVDDQGILHENVQMDAPFIEHNCECRYGCGIFELTKR